MWLRNWYSMLNAALLSRTGDAIPGTNPSDEPAISIRNFNGNYTKVNSQTGRTYSLSADLFNPGKFQILLGTAYSSSDTATYTLILGTGTTPVTLDDYRIETPIASGLSLASTGTTIVNKTALNNGRYSYKTRAAINNTSSGQIVINEVAINAATYAGQAVAASGFCVYREVLSTPITLEAGDTVLVEFAWDAPIYQAPTP